MSGNRIESLRQMHARESKTPRQIIDEQPGHYISEDERTRLGLVIPCPDEFGGPLLDGVNEACHMCWGSGDGDAPAGKWGRGDGSKGACTRCRGYSVEPREVQHQGHWHMAYGGGIGDHCELGRPRFGISPMRQRAIASILSVSQTHHEHHYN
jgi:hypothetical protein